MRRPNPFPNSAPVRFLCALAILLALPFTLPGFSLPTTQAQSATPTLLLQAANLVYAGAFRLPAPTGSGETQTFGYGGEAMAYDPYRNSLWITGHDWHDRLAEVTVPAPGTGSVSSLPRASFKTSWIDMTWRNPLSPSGAQVNMGGILPQSNGDLILSAYIYYDASNVQSVAHVRRSANGTISAPVRVGQQGRQGFVSGYMVPIPAEWQSSFGGPALTGNSSLSIVSRTSLGPAAWVFNPSSVGSGSTVAATEVLGYPIDHPTLGTCETGVIFNCSASNNRAGIVFPNGTRSVLYFHRICNNTPVYNAGWHCSSGGSRVTRVLAYDALDLLAVKNGQKQPWDVRPYAEWDLGAPLANARLTAVTYDPINSRILVSQDHGDGSQPLIHVYNVNGAANVAPPPPPPPPPPPAPSSPTPAPAPAPTVDTTNPSVTISSPASGTVVTGSLTVAATASDNIGVVGVQFTLDGANLGSEDTSAPYQVSWDTTKSGNSSHTLRAWARDAAGNTSSSAVTVTVNNATAPADATPPSVSLTSPARDTAVAGTITLQASATDNVGVTAVQFTLNGVSLGNPVGAPFALPWVTTTVPDGVYTLRAVARDAAGNSSQSASRQVTVANAPTLPEKDEDLGGDWADGPRDGDDNVTKDGDSGPRRARDKARGLASSRDLWRRVQRDGPRETRTSSDAVAVRPLASDSTSGSSSDTPGGRQSLADRPGSKASGRLRQQDAAAPGGDAPPAGPLMECPGTNPYESSAGQIGICANGEWTLVQGIRTWGTVRRRTLPEGQVLWVIETDEAVYDVSGGLGEPYREDGLEVLFEGWFRTDLNSALDGAHVIEVRLVTATDQQ